MISKKRLVLISVLTILLVVGGLYATYAINVFEEEVTPIEYDMAFNFDLSGSITREMTVEAGKTKVFDLDITNPYSDTIQYGVAYSMVSPTTLQEGVTIAESSLSKNSAVGMIDANETLSISVVAVNESSSSITLSFSVINGYKNGGDLIVPTGSTLVEGSYEVVPPEPLTSAEVLENLGLTSLLRTGIPDFTQAATTDEGIYAAEDDLGTSYYFRGASTRNYVKFGKNKDNQDMYWRIIRINGDGTVRLTYDGTQAYDNGISSSFRIAYDSPFNDEAHSNGGVGFMYGSTLGSTYELEHANDVNSDIKTFLEGEQVSENTGWYYENIVATGYDDYIADAIYCNDRSLYSGTGVGRTYTEYGAYGRLYANSEASVNPVLTCEREEDRFTSEPIVGSVKGNDKLKYPVGLITADEVSMAGGIFGENKNYYLYKGQVYWTMSVSHFDDVFEEARAFFLYSDGYLELSLNVFGSRGVCPVISLKADALKHDAATSNGTQAHPFVLAS